MKEINGDLKALRINFTNHIQRFLSAASVESLGFFFDRAYGRHL